MRISFDEVEGLEGEKLVLFVSKKDEKAKAQAKASIKVLRSVKNIHASSSNRDENIGGFSYVLVDCAASCMTNPYGCDVAGLWVSIPPFITVMYHVTRLDHLSFLFRIFRCLFVLNFKHEIFG